MAGSISKTILVGHLGNDPEVKTMQSGDKVANFTLATSESWKEKSSGERKTRTEWHRIVVFNQNLIPVCENYLKKGGQVYIEGQNETRSYDRDGAKVYTTEVVLRPFRGEITMLGSFKESAEGQQAPQQGRGHQEPIEEDSIPF